MFFQGVDTSKKATFSFSPLDSLNIIKIDKNEISIKTDTPQTARRQEIEPSEPPTKGPIDIPSPIAASYSMIDFSVCPISTLTIADKAVEMNKAFLSPSLHENKSMHRSYWTNQRIKQIK